MMAASCRIVLSVVLSVATLIAFPAAARGFCGFYVAGADQKLFNNATMVVLMREGTRTVLSMQNNYQGPPENFAMVVPVPVVLQQENVKTLPDGVFDRVDKLAAPRLVEYWEQDPCAMRPGASAGDALGARLAAKMAAAPGRSDYGVQIEAQFKVGEYEIVILSASDSLGLDAWLRHSGYQIPEGTEPLLRPYVAGGSKFFVAKVDVSKVRFDKGMAKLSPLRFHYDSDTFSLPVRLGLVNSAGTQDLIVHILARRQRYDVANYKNVTIPTNIDVEEGARGQFGAFYAALFDRTLEENPGAVVTEYAWDASTCDPCPSPVLTPAELATLGADVLPGMAGDAPVAPNPRPAPPASGPCGCASGDLMCQMKCATKKKEASPPPRSPPPQSPELQLPRPQVRRPWQMGGFVLTRLHARYGKSSLGEDLVFREATPIMGGREVRGQGGKLESSSQQGDVNTFQGRYAIRHPWTGPIACDTPQRGVWGGPPRGTSAPGGTQVAQDLAFAPRGGIQLASMVRHDVPEIRLKTAIVTATDPVLDGAAPAPQSNSGCGSCALATGLQNETHSHDRSNHGGMVFSLALLMRLRRLSCARRANARCRSTGSP